MGGERPILGAIFLNMEILLEKQLQAALAERKSVMGEFLRLKAELARTQQRNDDLLAPQDDRNRDDRGNDR